MCKFWLNWIFNWIFNLFLDINWIFNWIFDNFFESIGFSIGFLTFFKISIGFLTFLKYQLDFQLDFLTFIKYQLDFNWIFFYKNIESIYLFSPHPPPLWGKNVRISLGSARWTKLSKLGYLSLELGTDQPQLVIFNFIKVLILTKVKFSAHR